MYFLKNHVKNIRGWTGKQKILCLAFDDYGNIRLSCRKALNAILKKADGRISRFDYFDALDNRKDFELLFEVLKSVRDKNGNPAIITAYAVPCNVDFIESLKNKEYRPENLDQTYFRLSLSEPEHYAGAFELMKYGVSNGLLHPQFHGREHLNVNLFNALLAADNPTVIENLLNKSMVALPTHKDFPNVKCTEAYAFWDENEIELHKQIIEDGLKQFEKVFGLRPTTFTPPAMKLHPSLYQFLEEKGILAINKAREGKIHLGYGKYFQERNITGIQSGQNHVTIVRNCMFEPNINDVDWVNFTFNQIKAAFFWRKPAIISSHRVNFCGHIDPSNRERGLSALSSLLKKIVKTWPDVVFMSIENLALKIINQKK